MKDDDVELGYRAVRGNVTLPECLCSWACRGGSMGSHTRLAKGLPRRTVLTHVLCFSLVCLPRADTPRGELGLTKRVILPDSFPAKEER